MNTLWVGIPVVFFGFGLMFWHWRAWQVRAADSDPRERQYYYRLFKRRTIVGSLIAITGSVIASLQWVSDPAVFTFTVALLLVLLLGLFGMAVLDMVSVLVHFRHGREGAAARRALIEEYVRLRNRLAGTRPDGTADEGPP